MRLEQIPVSEIEVNHCGKITKNIIGYVSSIYTCKRLFFYIIDSKFAESRQVLGKGREIFCLEDTDGQVLAKDCEIL